LGRVKFVTAKAEPAVHQRQPAFDWSDLESHLRELVKLLSERPSRFAIESHLTFAHEPHHPLVRSEQLDAGDQLILEQQAAADRKTDPPPQGCWQPQQRHEMRARPARDAVIAGSAFSHTILN
jgi:hypothetical protein